MSSPISEMEAANAQRIAAGCPECGERDQCYNLCPNSPAYYSREREMQDEPFYGDDDMSERYAAERDDMRMEDEYAAMADAECVECGEPVPIKGDTACSYYCADVNESRDDIPF